MSKIAIVGVEGSGKSTLMAVFGEKYMSPDVNGYSLEPNDQSTFAVIGNLIANLRQGKWPSATAHSTVNALSWTLLRRKDDKVEEVGEFTFLDYAGEIYRLAFGQSRTEDERGSHAAQIAALRDHIEAADVLVVMVNLSDIINGSLSDPRVQEMIFQTGNIIKSAVCEGSGKAVALAFSQVDKYRQIIEDAGGIRAAYAKYLPLVEARNPKLKLFEVSAVDKAVVDKNGNENPAPDYGSQGLEELMAWVAAYETRQRMFTWRRVLRFLLFVFVCLSGMAAVGCWYFFGWPACIAVGAVGVVVCLGVSCGGRRRKTLRFKNTNYKSLAGPRPGDEMTIKLPGGVPMTFCWCPATTSEDWKRVSGGGSYFMMGSPRSEYVRGSDEEVHRVTLTKGFWMGKFEVTQKQWRRAMGTNPSLHKGNDRPVERVSWVDCQEFIRKIIADGNVKVSLPTEAQWEYACRAGTTTPFSFGTTLNGDEANCNGNSPYGTERKGRYRQATAQVGSYAPNAWGFCDMHGNVYEWCADWYGDYAGDATDPIGPASGGKRVIRGGSWAGCAQRCRSANRGSADPNGSNGGVGFRLVCSAKPE